MRVIFGALLASLPHPAWADLPLTVEDLITDKGKLKLEASISYANADRQGISTDDPLTIQTGPTSFITLPTRIGESISNSDTTVATLDLRYGLTARAEIYASAVWHPASAAAVWTVPAQKPMQLAALSAQEMRETKGAFLNFVIASGGGMSGNSAWQPKTFFGFSQYRSYPGW
ncbi:MAG: hypothetical protein WAN92_06250 [Herbaspirillum sp.]